MLTRNSDGTAGVSPYLSIINRTAATMMKACSELGFSPAARPRLVAAGLAPMDQAGEDAAWGRLKVLQGGKAG